MPISSNNPYSLIFDFDGVIADTYDIYIEFLVKKMRLSHKYATKRFEQSSTELTAEPSGFIYKIAARWYYYRFYRYIKKQNHSLIFSEVLTQIKSLHHPKAILTLAEKRVCQTILQDDMNVFDIVIGRNEEKLKVNGFKTIMEHPSFKNTIPIFITDTAADVRNMLAVLPEERIFAVDWGFNTLELLLEHLPESQILRHDLTDLIRWLDFAI